MKPEPKDLTVIDASQSRELDEVIQQETKRYGNWEKATKLRKVLFRWRLRRIAALQIPQNVVIAKKP